ncbi:MAG: HK97 family phage prohead protease [Panacagrimonas sp.]
MTNRSREERIVRAKREIRARSYDGIERRTVRTPVLLRATGDGPDEFRGHAYVFNDLSEDLGFFDEWYERIAVGAGATAIPRSDIRALVNHNPDLALARTSISAPAPGWLTVLEDNRGLDTRFVPTPTTYAADLRVNVAAGVVNQMSFAFRVARKGDEWEEEPAPWNEDKLILVRTINQFSEFYDVSPVTYPAYPTTDIDLSSRTDRARDGDETDDEPAPTSERTDDGPAEERVHDGEGEGQQAGECSARIERAERLRLRIGEPPL